MKKYRVSGYKWVAGNIEEIDVERETEQSVWINGRRNAKVTDYDVICDDWESAHQFLLDRKHEKVEYARSILADAEKNLAIVKEMKKQ